jgi:hypothetical protein
VRFFLREQPKPTGDADRALLVALQGGNLNSPAIERLGLPPFLMDSLGEVVARKGTPDQWMECAATLDGVGLATSALHILQLTQVRLDSREARQRLVSQRLDLERRLGMTSAATIDARTLRRLDGQASPDDRIPELEEDGLYAQMARHDPAAHRALITALGPYDLVRDPLRDPLMSKIFFENIDPQSNSQGVDDCSFFIMDGDGRPVVQVEADVLGGRYLGCRETGIEITLIAADHPQLEAAQRLAVRQLQLITEWTGTFAAMMEWRLQTPPCLPVQNWVNEYQVSPNRLGLGWIDLSLDLDAIVARYRTAHRQSLRWGLAHMTVTGSDSPDPELLGLYDRIYTESRRPVALATDQLARLMAEGRMSLYIGYCQDRPVVTLVTSHHLDTTYYWASAKLPVGNKPLGHMVLHHAIAAAQARGQGRFHLGLLHVGQTYSDKLKSIALYKRGFATHYEDVLHVGALL